MWSSRSSAVPWGAAGLAALLAALGFPTAGCGRSSSPGRGPAPPDRPDGARAGAVTPAPAPRAVRFYERRRTLYFGIPARLRFAPADERLAARVWRELESVDAVFNSYVETSEVGRLNADSLAALRAGRPGPLRREVSPALADALRLSLELHRLTRGAFDVTVKPLRRLWQGAARRGRAPSPPQLGRALARVGSRHLRLEGRRLTLARPGLGLDFGGIVKGIAVDRVIAMLRAGGARSALVMLGGETAAYGLAAHGARHQLGVAHPLSSARVWAALRDPGQGISSATSGNRHNPVRIGGRTYYHIVSPRTGQPVSTHVLQVTVVFPGTGKNGLADGLSTAAAVLGPEVALPLVRTLGGEALILVQRGRRILEHATPGWAALLIGGASSR